METVHKIPHVGISLIRILRQALADHILKPVGIILYVFDIRIDFQKSLTAEWLDVGDGGLFVEPVYPACLQIARFATEWRIACKHLEQEDTEGIHVHPDIALTTSVLGLEFLRSPIFRMPLVPEAAANRNPVLDSQAKIQKDISTVSAPSHDVGGMEIVMRNSIVGDKLFRRHLPFVAGHHHRFVALRMENGQRAADVTYETQDFLIGDETCVGMDVIGERPAGNILHLDHRPIHHYPGAPDPDNVGMADVAYPQQQGALFEEGVGRSLVLADGVVQHLEGADIAELTVPDKPDLCYATLPKQLKHIVTGCIEKTCVLTHKIQ